MPLEPRCWRLDDLLGDENGHPISGRLAKQDMITTNLVTRPL